MSIQEIIDIEEKNEDSIYLYKEGVFWKAYQKSTFLTVTRFRPDFRIKVKDMKCVGRKVLSVGFPISSLSSVFGESPIEELDGKRIRIRVGSIDEEAYKLWMTGVAEKTNYSLSPFQYSLPTASFSFKNCPV